MGSSSPTGGDRRSWCRRNGDGIAGLCRGGRGAYCFTALLVLRKEDVVGGGDIKGERPLKSMDITGVSLQKSSLSLCSMTSVVVGVRCGFRTVTGEKEISSSST